MSIFIFGSVTNSGEEKSDLNWTGNWYFAKNKTHNTTFSYTKSPSNAVSRDLVDYVSFVNEPQAEKLLPGVKKGRKGKWHRARGKGRPSGMEVKSEGHDVPVGVVTGQQENQHLRQMKREPEDVNTELQAIGVGDPSVLTNSDESLSAESEPPSTPLITIPPRHPLFGLWEGSFTLPAKINTQGTRGGIDRHEVEEVPETFFFYAFEGEHQREQERLELQQQHNEGQRGEGIEQEKKNQAGTGMVSGLEDLPHPPRWSAGFIRELHSADRLDHNQQGQEQVQEQRISALVSAAGWSDSPTIKPQKAMKKEVSFDKVLVSGTSGPSEHSHDEGESGDAVGIDLDDDAGNEEHASGVTVANSSDIPGPVAQTDVEKVGSEPKVVESVSTTPFSNKSDSDRTLPRSAPRFSQQQVTPNSALLVPPEEDVMVVGFGRNQYGRFSLAGAYNPRTGSLRCERKYMLTKFISPKLHRASSHLDGTATGSEKRPARAKRSLSVGISDSYGTPSGGQLSSTVASGKRKRSSSLWLLESAGDTDLDDGSFPYLDTHYTTPTVYPSTSKRGRKKMGGQLYNATSLPHQPHSYSQAMTSAQYLAIMAAAAEQEGYHRAFLDPSTGEVYEGEWGNGHRNGFGVALFPDGTLYEGMWLNSKESGTGVWMTGAREVLYRGDWAEGRMHGVGTYYFPSGDVYTGEFREGSRHGRGRYNRADGSSYEGDWKDNARHGRGIFTWTDGSEYDGDWEGGQRAGRGELNLSNGLSYSGIWAGTLMEGRGELCFPDGQEYKGMFKNGLREGRGSLVFPEGATYEGRFREDALDGQGTLKISKTVPGAAEDEVYIPLDNLADIRRIHYKSGFGGDDHH